ncbi:hypothetical protein RQP46_001236 [Phenoliferia psychrophenolica]
MDPAPPPVPPGPQLKTKRVRPAVPAVAQDLWTRRAVTLAFWAVALVGVPYWWTTTTIERRPLPLSQLQQWSRKAPCYLRPPVSLSILSLSSPQTKTDGKHLLDPSQLEASCIDLVPAQSGERTTPGGVEPTEYSLVEEPGQRGGLGISRRTFRVGQDTSDGDKRALAATLLGLDGGDRDGVQESDPRVVKFAPRFTLVFTLMNQDATQGGALLDWDIQHLLETHLRPLLTSLAPLHIFTIETRIQYFAPLSINVAPAANDANGTVVDEADLRAFVNSAEWNIDTLKAIVDLVDELPNMRVGRDVQRGVRTALGELALAEVALSHSPSLALSHAALARELASRAYFNPTMLALLYFPDEHKYAVYTPLFGPIAVPMLAALGKEFKEWRERRRKAKAKAAAGAGETEGEVEEGKEKVE